MTGELGYKLTVAGLFSGIGGIELGLCRAGHTLEMLCEIDVAAQRVLHNHFPKVRLEGDVRKLRELPDVDLVVAGFPCQDLSQAGRMAGMSGQHSSIVEWVFRLLHCRSRGPRWVLFENVPFMLHLKRGEAMRILIQSLEQLGFAWAYRVIDTRAFGLPQRRPRVFMLASSAEDPREVLLTDDVGEPAATNDTDVACGFYWTEGNRGLGWAVDAVPPLKGGSGLTIPSPPGVWMQEEHSIVTPDIRDAERLQGFEPDWTLPSVAEDEPTEWKPRRGLRWRLVGNAVSVPVAAWIGARLAAPQPYDTAGDEIIQHGDPLPPAAWGAKGKIYRVRVSSWPVREEYHHLADFMQYPRVPLSARATRGFYQRVTASKLRVKGEFVRDLAAHMEKMSRMALTDDAPSLIVVDDIARTMRSPVLVQVDGA